MDIEKHKTSIKQDNNHKLKAVQKSSLIRCDLNVDRCLQLYMCLGRGFQRVEAVMETTLSPQGQSWGLTAGDRKLASEGRSVMVEQVGEVAWGLVMEGSVGKKEVCAERKGPKGASGDSG